MGCGDPNPVSPLGDGGAGDGDGMGGDDVGDGDGDSTNTAGDGDGDTTGDGDGGDGDSTSGDGDGDGDSSNRCDNGFGRVGGVCLAEDGTVCEEDADCVNANCVSGVCCAEKCDENNECQTPSCEDGSTCVYDAIADCTFSNGGLCEDGDECESGHCVNGICCAQACDSPPECRQVEGTFCIDEGTVCDYGKLANETACDDGNGCTEGDWCVNGECIGQSPKDCRDDLDCTFDNCDPATGNCTNPAIVPETDCEDDNNPCTDPVCEENFGNGGGGCAVEPNNVSCDDGDGCTENDVCGLGFCQAGTPKDCSGSDAECSVGECVGGSCMGNDALAEGDDCTSTVDACDLGGMCNASGGCAVVGEGEACGTFASSCAPCGGGGQPACNTADGSGRNCACQGGYEQRDGTCQVANDECDPNPCGANTSCTDTPGANNEVCSCLEGYEPIGATPDGGCQDIDECDDGTDDCGALTCTNTEPGFVCGCIPPQFFEDGECRCELEGTFIQLSTVVLTWSGIDGVANAPPEGFTTYGWGLRRHTIDGNGDLQVDMIPCGGTAPDVCDTVFDLAHTQYQPNQVWGGDGMPRPNFEVPAASFADTPGASYDEPMIAVTMGIQFTDPGHDPINAVWPCSGDCVGRSAGDTCTCPDFVNGGTDSVTVVDPTIWLDSDLDGELGVTTWAVLDTAQGNMSRTQRGPGAPIDGTDPDPPVARGTTSDFCGGWDYSWWPANDGTLWGVEAFYSATRTVSRLDGSLNDSCQLVGDITGPNSPSGCGTGGNPPCNQLRAQARVADCEGAHGLFGNGYGRCSVESSGTVHEFFDHQEQTNQAQEATFMIEHASERTTITLTGSESASELEQACQEVREAYCPSGEDCSITP